MLLFRNTFLLLWVLILATSGSSCSSTDDAQKQFEDDAFRQPTNFTRTDGNGDIIEEDPNDWRIGPMFSGFVEMGRPAFPNPTTGQIVTIELLVTGISSVNGLEVVTFDRNGRFKLLYFDERRPLPVGFSSINFDPVLLDPNNSGTISGARGLRRVFIFDQRGNLITYGDIRVD
ncbi:MAG: hypothetical protein LAT67_03835 [Balneolales bacterium]|nr:hypothetical protein [Balneolales bacterium]